jgi:hypothetical protein
MMKLTLVTFIFDIRLIFVRSWRQLILERGLVATEGQQKNVSYQSIEIVAEIKEV